MSECLQLSLSDLSQSQLSQAPQSFQVLPNEVLFNILRFLTYKQILPLLICNRNLNARDYDNFWRYRANSFYKIDCMWEFIPRETGLEKYVWIRENHSPITLILRCCYLLICSDYDIATSVEITSNLISTAYMQHDYSQDCLERIKKFLFHGSGVQKSINNHENRLLASQSTCHHTFSCVYDKSPCTSFFCLFIKNKLSENGLYYWLSDKCNYQIRSNKGLRMGIMELAGPQGIPGIQHHVICNGGPQGPAGDCGDAGPTKRAGSKAQRRDWKLQNRRR